MCIAFSYTIFSRIPLELDILRDRGQLYNETSDGLIENVYKLKLANKEQRDHDYRITITGIEGLKLISEPVVTIKAGELLDYNIRIHVKKENIKRPNYDIQINVQALDNDSISITEDNRFIGPAPRR